MLGPRPRPREHNRGSVVTDAQRDRATRVLRERYANGVLTLSEFDARLDAVLSARSDAELHAVLHDSDLDELPTRMLDTDIGASDLERLERFLASSEEVYWTGHPDTSLRLAPQDVNRSTRSRDHFNRSRVII